MKKGDKVEIVGEALSVGVKFSLGSTGEIMRHTSQGNFEVWQDGSGWIYPPSSLRLVSAFKPGDRVRLPGKLVSYPGETETTIKTVYRSDGGHGPHDLYELADGSYRRFEELQHAPEPDKPPKREPKRGEVWSVQTTACVLVDDYVKLRPIAINTSTLFTVDGGYAAALRNGDCEFIASDLAAYFKARQ